MHTTRTTLLATAAAATLLAGVDQAQAVLAFGVNERNQLISFDTTNPAALLSGRAISGLASQERIEGIDFRPRTGELFALGTFGNLYTLNTSTGAATSVMSGIPLNGASFGFDFNPAADAAGNPSLRITSDVNQNLAVNVDTGVIVTATNLFYPGGQVPNVVGQAYTNNFPGGSTSGTVQYAIDSGLDLVVIQQFNAGQLDIVGPLGTVDTTDRVGFDIFTDLAGNNSAFATLNPAGTNRSNLYSINLTTGTATFLGEIGGGQVVPNFAVTLVPEPTSALALMGVAGLALARRRKA